MTSNLWKISNVPIIKSTKDIYLSDSTRKSFDMWIPPGGAPLEAKSVSDCPSRPSSLHLVSLTVELCFVCPDVTWLLLTPTSIRVRVKWLDKLFRPGVCLFDQPDSWFDEPIQLPGIMAEKTRRSRGRLLATMASCSSIILHISGRGREYVTSAKLMRIKLTTRTILIALTLLW